MPDVSLFYFVLPVTLSLIGAACLMQSNRTKATLQRANLFRWAVSALGSAGIIWGVYLLSSVLQILVVVVLVGWFNKRIFFPNGIRTRIPLTGLTWLFRWKKAR